MFIGITVIVMFTGFVFDMKCDPKDQSYNVSQFLTLSVRNNPCNNWITTIFSLRCTLTGATQATADFTNCVSGDTVTAMGLGYDFKSVMHYTLRRLNNLYLWYYCTGLNIYFSGMGLNVYHCLI